MTPRACRTSQTGMSTNAFASTIHPGEDEQKSAAIMKQDGSETEGSSLDRSASIRNVRVLDLQRRRLLSTTDNGEVEGRGGAHHSGPSLADYDDAFLLSKSRRLSPNLGLDHCCTCFLFSEGGDDPSVGANSVMISAFATTSSTSSTAPRTRGPCPTSVALFCDGELVHAFPVPSSGTGGDANRSHIGGVKIMLLPLGGPYIWSGRNSNVGATGGRPTQNHDKFHCGFIITLAGVTPESTAFLSAYSVVLSTSSQRVAQQQERAEGSASLDTTGKQNWTTHRKMELSERCELQTICGDDFEQSFKNRRIVRAASSIESSRLPSNVRIPHLLVAATTLPLSVTNNMPSGTSQHVHCVRFALCQHKCSLFSFPAPQYGKTGVKDASSEMESSATTLIDDAGSVTSITFGRGASYPQSPSTLAILTPSQVTFIADPSSAKIESKPSSGAKHLDHFDCASPTTQPRNKFSHFNLSPEAFRAPQSQQTIPKNHQVISGMANLLLSGCHPTHRLGPARIIIPIDNDTSSTTLSGSEGKDASAEEERFAILCEPKCSEFSSPPNTIFRKTVSEGRATDEESRRQPPLHRSDVNIISPLQPPQPDSLGTPKPILNETLQTLRETRSNQVKQFHEDDNAYSMGDSEDEQSEGGLLDLRGKIGTSPGSKNNPLLSPLIGLNLLNTDAAMGNSSSPPISHVATSPIQPPPAYSPQAIHSTCPITMTPQSENYPDYVAHIVIVAVSVSSQGCSTGISSSTTPPRITVHSVIPFPPELSSVDSISFNAIHTNVEGNSLAKKQPFDDLMFSPSPAKATVKTTARANDHTINQAVEQDHYIIACTLADSPTILHVLMLATAGMKCVHQGPIMHEIGKFDVVDELNKSHGQGSDGNVLDGEYLIRGVLLSAMSACHDLAEPQIPSNLSDSSNTFSQHILLKVILSKALNEKTKTTVAMAGKKSCSPSSLASPVNMSTLSPCNIAFVDLYYLGSLGNHDAPNKNCSARFSNVISNESKSCQEHSSTGGTYTPASRKEITANVHLGNKLILNKLDAMLGAMSRFEERVMERIDNLEILINGNTARIASLENNLTLR